MNGNDSAAPVVLIAGAATPTGRSVAEAFAHAGATLVLTDVNGGHLDEVAERIELRCGARPDRALLAVPDGGAWQTVVDDAEARHGRVDVVVNAAVYDPDLAWRQATAEDWTRVTDVNLLGVVLGLAAALPALGRSGGAYVVLAHDAQRVLGASARAAALAFAEAVRADVPPAVQVVAMRLPAGSEHRAGELVAAGLRAHDAGATHPGYLSYS